MHTLSGFTFGPRTKPGRAVGSPKPRTVEQERGDFIRAIPFAEQQAILVDFICRHPGLDGPGLAAAGLDWRLGSMQQAERDGLIEWQPNPGKRGGEWHVSS